MGVAGWSTTEPADIGDLTLLPRGFMWNSDPNGVMAEIIRNVTTGGKRYDGFLFERELREYNFHYPQDENSQFVAMYRAARAQDIYFVPDSDNMAGVIRVRLEEPNYLPKNTGAPGHINDSMQMWFMWTFRISTEVDEEVLLP